ncbi:Signal transduction response regulator, receiver domain [Dillenia turbinata]|uniref:Signal transduction response regulator, receiver domain n=1 Tax=Dillenia turbinata TaxID=194707 RepID=A0AAN8V0I9_9MAGN
MDYMAAESNENVTKYYPPKVDLNVMLVDRDLVELVRLRRFFESCSYKVATFNVESAALATLQDMKGEYDLVLADVHMPELDHYFFLRTVVEKHGVPVILMSADPSPEIARKAIDHGACFFQQKPLDIETVRSLWQHVLRVRIMMMKMVQLKANHVQNANENGENITEITQAGEGVSSNKTGETTFEIQDKVEKNDSANVNDINNLTREQNMKLIDQLQESYRPSMLQGGHGSSLMPGQTNSLIQKPPRLAPSPPDVGSPSRHAMPTPFGQHLLVPHQRGISCLIQSRKHNISSDKYSPRSSSTSAQSLLSRHKLDMIDSQQTGRLNQSSTLLGRLNQPSFLSYSGNEFGNDNSFPMSSVSSLLNFNNAATMSSSSNIVPNKNSIGTGKQYAVEMLESLQKQPTSDKDGYGISNSSSLQQNNNRDGLWGANTTPGNTSNEFGRTKNGFRNHYIPHPLYSSYTSSHSNAQEGPNSHNGSSSPSSDIGAIPTEKSCLGNPTGVGSFHSNNQYLGETSVLDNGQGVGLEMQSRSFPNYGDQTASEEGIGFGFSGQCLANSLFISPNSNNCLAGMDDYSGPSIWNTRGDVVNNGFPTTSTHAEQPNCVDQVDAFGGLTNQIIEEQNDCFDPNNAASQNSMLCENWLRNDSTIHVNGSTNLQSLANNNEEELDIVNQFLNDNEATEASNNIAVLGDKADDGASLVGGGNSVGTMSNENGQDNIATNIEDENIFRVDDADGGWYSSMNEQDYNVFFNGIEPPAELFVPREHSDLYR